MGTLYTYDKKGNQLASVTDALIGPGGIDWVGGNFMMACNQTVALRQFAVFGGGKRVALVDASRLPTGYTSFAVCKNHSFDSEENPFDGNLLVVLSQKSDMVNTLEMDLYRFEKGKSTTIHNYLSTAFTNMGGLCTDGHYHYLLFRNNTLPTPTTRFRKYLLDGKNARVIANLDFSSYIGGDAKDICYDFNGPHFYVVDSNGASSVLLRISPDLTTVTTAFSIPSGSFGVTTDGNNIYILGS